MKRTLIIILAALLLTSCATSGRGWFSKWMMPVDPAYLKIGMSESELRDVVRFPDDKNTTNVSGMIKEQWVYDTGLDTYYLYLENGVFVGWQKM